VQIFAKVKPLARYTCYPAITATPSHSKGDRKSVARPIKTDHAGRQNPRQSEAISGLLKQIFERNFAIKHVM
jgi:hypothetical protein